jgi:hypothetical protein
MTPNDVSSRGQLQASAGDQASVQGLVRLLERKGLIDKADLEVFYQDVAEAREQLVDLLSIISVILGVVQEAGSQKELDSALAEFCNGLSLAEALGKARQALDCLYMAPADKDQLRAILDSMEASL